MRVMLTVMLMLVEIMAKMMMMVDGEDDDITFLSRSSDCSIWSKAVQPLQMHFVPTRFLMELFSTRETNVEEKSSCRENDMLFELGLVCKTEFLAIIPVLWLNHTQIKDCSNWLKAFAIGQATFRISTTGGLFWRRRERPDSTASPISIRERSAGGSF